MSASKSVRWLATLTLVASGLACSSGMDEGFDTEDGLTEDAPAPDVMTGGDAQDVELGQTQQALWWWPSFTTSCYDPDGTESVMAAIAVATAKELRRWQPLVDFKIINYMLALTDTGKARCADGKCFNTQALLDFQKDAASKLEIRPGVLLKPSTLRDSLTKNWNKQKSCSYLWSFWGCKAPDHEFKFLQSAPGACDMNYWFEVRTPTGSLLSSSGLSDLKEKLVWLNEDDNSYINFQTDGNSVAIDPTYGLNETSATTVGSCSAACSKISSTDISGQCCTCNGTKKYIRSVWSATTYMCQ